MSGEYENRITDEYTVCAIGSGTYINVVPVSMAFCQDDSESKEYGKRLSLTATKSSGTAISVPSEYRRVMFTAQYVFDDTGTHLTAPVVFVTSKQPRHSYDG